VPSVSGSDRSRRRRGLWRDESRGRRPLCSLLLPAGWCSPWGKAGRGPTRQCGQSTTHCVVRRAICNARPVIGVFHDVARRSRSKVAMRTDEAAWRGRGWAS
jgi:hypothetical protein